ncbi:MAG: FHA domain-containing protein [Rhodopirellula sp.]|nr:FHA domain-containing protein [Rhodopirellula sp.]
MSTVPILIAEDDRRNIVIDRPAIVVGRSRRRSDICIDDRSISAVHCEISIGDNCLQVRNRGRNGIRINGRKSDEGDRVPLLKTWPGIATVVTGLVLAGLVVAALLMRPSYDGTEVSGMVTLNGQPRTDATISFTDLQSGFGASAVVGPNGEFEVVTLKGGMKPGTCNIAVMPMKPDANSQVPPSAIPFHCRSIQTSGITREITDEGPNDLLIELAATPD